MRCRAFSRCTARQLQGLLRIEPRVARGLVAAGQIHVRDVLRATQAFRHALELAFLVAEMLRN